VLKIGEMKQLGGKIMLFKEIKNYLWMPFT